MLHCHCTGVYAGTAADGDEKIVYDAQYVADDNYFSARVDL